MVSSYLSENQLEEFVKLNLIPNLNPLTKLVFGYLFQLLGRVHMVSAKNLMTASNLAIVWTPNFLKGDDPLAYLAAGSATDKFRSIVKCIIEKHLELF
jgi:hypothetical protein